MQGQVVILRAIWKSSSPSTVPVHGESPGNFSNFPGYEQSSLDSLELELYTRVAYLEKKTGFPSSTERIVGFGAGLRWP